jgi:hypothetical protein
MAPSLRNLWAARLAGFIVRWSNGAVHSRDWQGVRDGAGRTQPGVYLCRFTADTFRAEEKLVVAQ